MWAGEMGNLGMTGLENWSHEWKKTVEADAQRECGAQYEETGGQQWRQLRPEWAQLVILLKF